MIMTMLVTITSNLKAYTASQNYLNYTKSNVIRNAMEDKNEYSSRETLKRRIDPLGTHSERRAMSKFCYWTLYGTKKHVQDPSRNHCGIPIYLGNNEYG